MKKFILASVAFAMLFASLGIVFVQAKPYDTYPYVYEDFENGLGSVTKNGNVKSLTHVSGGAGGSAGAALVEVANKNNGDIESICTFAPQIGGKVKFSVWIKLDNTELKADVMSFIIYGRGNVYKTDETVEGPEVKEVTGWKQIVVGNKGLKKGEWVKVTSETVWDGQLTCFPGTGYNGVANNNTTAKTSDILGLKNFAIRVGSNGGSSDIADENETVLRYYMDDLVYEAIPVEISGAVPGANIVPNGEFDDNTSGWACGGKATIVKDPSDPAPDGSAGYLRIEPNTENTPYFAQLDRQMTWQPNHVYKVSYYAKIDSTTETATKGGAWLLQLAGKRVPDTNGQKLEYPGNVLNDIMEVGNGWTKVEYYYLHEYKTFTEQPLTTWLRLYPMGKKDVVSVGVYGLDSFKVIDLGAVSNGDFEIGAADLRRNDAAASQSVLGWNANNADVSQSSDIRPGSEGAHSMQVMVNGAGGYTYQGLSLKNDSIYKLSFWAKGSGLETDVPFALVLDRNVPSPGGDSECFVVPDYQYYTGAHEVSEEYTDAVKQNQQWKLTNEWQYYECYFNNTFPLKEGMAEQLNVMPRLPFLYFDVDGNKAGTTYLLDDMSIEGIGKEPVITNAVVEGNIIPGKEVRVSYQYSSSKNYEDMFSMVRVLSQEAGNEVTLGTFKADAGFIIPETAIGKNIVFEILPIDEMSQCGNPVRLTAPKPPAWAKLYIGEDFSVRAYSSENTSGKIIFAAYKDNELVSVCMEDAQLSPYTKTEISTPAEFQTEGADMVKVMFWNGLDAVKPLCGAETVK